MSLKNDLKKIEQLFRNMEQQQRQSVLEFAEFQQIRSSAKPDGDTGSVITAEAETKPLEIPRPDEENVVMAIKRLSKTYPMLDKASLLNETSLLMSKHVLQGVSATDVIDELESLFSGHYQQYKEKQGQNSV